MGEPVFTKTPEGEEIVILSRVDYEVLVTERDEETEARDVLAALSRGEEETLTFAEIEALRVAPTPLAFWRRHRGVIQAELAVHAGVPQSYVSDIENGRKRGHPALLRKFADYLKVSLDDLVP